MAGNTFTIQAGTIKAKVLVAGVPTLTPFTWPTTAMTMPSDGTYCLAYDFMYIDGTQKPSPGLVLFLGRSSVTYPNAIPLYLITQMGAISGNAKITAVIDLKNQGGIGSQNLQTGAVTASSLASGVLMLANDGDIDFTTMAVGRILANSPSNGKAFSFIDFSPSYALCVDDSVGSTDGYNLTDESNNLLLTN